MAAEEEIIDRLQSTSSPTYSSSSLPSPTWLGKASGVCRKWREGVRRSVARRERLSFSGRKMDDESTARLVRGAYNLKELDISRSCWGCRITDDGLYEISLAKCVSNLTSVSLWGITGITDRGVVQLLLFAGLCLVSDFDSPKLSYSACDVFSDIWVVIEIHFKNNFPSAPEHRGYIYNRRIFIRNCSKLHPSKGEFSALMQSVLHGYSQQLQAIVLWRCCHVTESGLVALVNNCRKLESINVFGMRVPVDCFIRLLAISPALQLKPAAVHLNVASVPFWAVH
ncbi:hypothetical protein Scep_020243 [Stephania cephalantha]|uniref:Uncharacterized protein n=1 Tax=Stephania cephalantha TaxID=152367 RepID=A0AAP0ICB5_9MAGN